MTDRRKIIGEFELKSILLMALSVISGIAGYLYQIILGNFLSVESYGQANVLITYVSLATMVLQPICTLANRNVAIYKAEDNENELTVFLAVIFEIILAACILICLILSGIVFGQYERMDSFPGLVYFTLTLITNIIYNLLLYITQGFKQFGKYGVVGLSYAVLKIVAAVIGINIIHDGSLILFSLTVANVFCIGLLLIPGKKDNIIRRYRLQNIRKWLPKIMPLYGWIFFIQLSLGFLSNGGDIVLVKYFFSDELSGVYAVSSNLCKIAIAAISPIITIMFTEAASNLSDKLKLKALLTKSLLYCSVAAGGYFLVLNVCGKWIVNILYGGRYEGAVSLLKMTSFYVMGVVWLNVLCQYYIALGKTKMIAIIMILIILTGMLASRIVTSIEGMLVICSMVVIVGAFLTIIKLYKDIR